MHVLDFTVPLELYSYKKVLLFHWYLLQPVLNFLVFVNGRLRQPNEHNTPLQVPQEIYLILDKDKDVIILYLLQNYLIKWIVIRMIDEYQVKIEKFPSVCHNYFAFFSYILMYICYEHMYAYEYVCTQTFGHEAIRSRNKSYLICEWILWDWQTHFIIPPIQ